jgi:hypothetical protein
MSPESPNESLRCQIGTCELPPTNIAEMSESINFAVSKLEEESLNHKQERDGSKLAVLQTPGTIRIRFCIVPNVLESTLFLARKQESLGTAVRLCYRSALLQCEDSRQSIEGKDLHNGSCSIDPGKVESLEWFGLYQHSLARDQDRHL